MNAEPRRSGVALSWAAATSARKFDARAAAEEVARATAEPAETSAEWGFHPLSPVSTCDRERRRGLFQALPLRPRHALLLLVVVLHALVLFLALLPRAPDRRPVPIPAIDAQVIAENPTPLQPPPEQPLTLERPHIDLITPDIPITESTPDAPSASPPTPAAAVAAVATASKKHADPPEPVTPPRFDAAYLNNPAPIYPMSSRRVHEQGTVTLRVRVSQVGTALEVLLEHTSGSSHLDDAAMEAVRRWRFTPAMRGRESVEAWVLVPVQFELRH